MIETITLYCKNLDRSDEFPIGVSLIEVADFYESLLGFKPMCALINNHDTCLSRKVYEPADIIFCGLKDEDGMRAYVRSLFFVISKAVDDIMPDCHLYIEHSLSNGYYCEIRNGHEVTAEDIHRIKQKAEQIIREKHIFTGHNVRTEEALKLFRNENHIDRCELLESIGAAYTRYYELDGYIDHFYNCLVPSTEYLHLFDFVPYRKGALLRVPDPEDTTRLKPFISQPKLSEAFDFQNRLLAVVDAKYVGDLNRMIRADDVEDMILVAEAFQEKRIAEISAEIAKKYQEGVRVVLISGPSSSGKTTFCKRLQVQLKTNLLKPHGISLDNYFVDRELSPVDEKGEYDFESLYALDLPFLNEQFTRILDGEEVDLPSFDFSVGKRVFRGEKLKLNDGEILMMEGIHALNPLLLENVDPSKTYKIYVSALTGIALDAHNRIPSTDNRLIRRIVRDYNYRGYSAVETIRRWPSVRKGEEKWVFPYQENADVMFNSAMLYELAALKPYAEPILREVPESEPEYASANRLLDFLRYFYSIPEHLLPSISIVREFLGGSSFKY